jgi:hypothetical protein
MLSKLFAILYWAVRRLSVLLFRASKALDWLGYKLYAKSKFNGAVGKHNENRIF